MLDVANALWRYKRALDGIESIKRLHSYKDALAFAKKAGTYLTECVPYEDLEGLTEEEIAQVLDPFFRELHRRTGMATAEVQRKINRAAGLGLNPIGAEYSPAQVREVARNVVGGVSAPEIAKEIVNIARQKVDEDVKANMRAHDSLGLETKIIRTYDNIGVHMRKDVCEWCVSRCGTYTSYADALAAGVFERHPGCGCTVEYHVGKTHTFRDASGAWSDL